MTTYFPVVFFCHGADALDALDAAAALLLSCCCPAVVLLSCARLACPRVPATKLERGVTCCQPSPLTPRPSYGLRADLQLRASIPKPRRIFTPTCSRLPFPFSPTPFTPCTPFIPPACRDHGLVLRTPPTLGIARSATSTPLVCVARLLLLCRSHLPWELAPRRTTSETLEQESHPSHGTRRIPFPKTRGKHHNSPQ